jgi:hypothetical protein
MTTIEDERADFLRTDAEPPPVGSSVFHTDIETPDGSWLEIRDSGIKPLNVSELSNSQTGREEFVKGCQLLGLGSKRMPNLVPQMLILADAANASPRFMGVLLPRRSSKTTSLFSLAIGRISSRSEYLVAYSMATTATKGRQRFLNDIMAPLLKRWPDRNSAPFKIDMGRGSESVTWFHEEGNSIFQFVTPRGDAFRSDAWDLIIIDEGGEATPEMSEDLIAGALSTMDTRPDATLIVAGTAAAYRDGNVLWDVLEDGRVGKNQTAIVEYAAPKDTTVRDIETWEEARELVLAAHPGIGTLTTLEIIESNYEKMSTRLGSFLREYLSIFARLGGSAFIDPVKWGEMKQTGKLPQPPEHFRIAFVVHPLQTSAAIVAAWRVDGKAHLLVMKHGKGVAWMRLEYLRLARKYKLPVVTDPGNNVNVSELEKLQRIKPKLQFELPTWAQVAAAAATLMQQIEDNNVVHYDQDDLNEAVRVVVKRGTKNSKMWAFGRGTVEENDITPIEAASLALRAYDQAKPRVPMVIITADS